MFSQTENVRSIKPLELASIYSAVNATLYFSFQIQTGFISVLFQNTMSGIVPPERVSRSAGQWQAEVSPGTP